MSTISRNGLSNKQWKKIKPFLPPKKPHAGRSNKSHRQIINAILWVLRTGAPWRDLPKCYGPWSTVYSRFYQWSKKGIWQKILDALLAQADTKGEIDWHLYSIDSTNIRAHQHAAGARKISLEGQERTMKSLALGYSQGSFSTKVNLRTDGNGKPIGGPVLIPGQNNESIVVEAVMAQGKVKRKGRGRPKQNSQALAGDKGYSKNRIRNYLRVRKIQVVIPTKKRERRRENFDKELYKQRNVIERCFNRFKHNRRLATRYEK